MTKQNLFLTAALCAAVIALTACSDTPKTAATETKSDTETKQEPAKPSGPLTAKTAFWEVYKPAHMWAADVAPLSITSGDAPGIKNEEGKAGMWTMVFVSPSKMMARTFTYSAVDQSNTIRKGVNIGVEQAWGGPTAQNKPFLISEFSTDSDAAYKTVEKKAEAWLKKNPGKEPTYTLGSANRFATPVWYILWGTNKNGYAGIVSATTGLEVTK